MDKKKILIISVIGAIIIAAIIIFIIISNKEPQEEFTIDGINLPVNKDILKETTVDNLKIKDIFLLTREEISSNRCKRNK